MNVGKLAALNYITKWDSDTDKDIAKTRREMREHPERFDFADFPPAELTQAQKDQIEANQPDWMEEAIANAQARKG